MFNGIIKKTGKIYSIKKKEKNCLIEISSKIKFLKNEIGSSISCSGACLTLENFSKNISRYYLSNETLNKTNLKFLLDPEFQNDSQSHNLLRKSFLEFCSYLLERVYFFQPIFLLHLTQVKISNHQFLA